MWAVSDMLGDFWHWAVLTFRRFDIVSIGALNPVTGRSDAVSGDSARPGAACIEVSARLAPTGPERSSRWVLPTRCEPCACTLRRTVLLQSAERILQKNRPKRKRSLVAPLGCAPIARSLGHVLSVYPLIIPRTLQPAEVWGKALGNVWGKC